MHLQKCIVLLSIIVFTLSCSKIDPIFNTQNTNTQKKPSKEQLALQEIQLEQMRQEAQELLDSLRTQEKILNQKAIELDSLQYALQMREILINEKESTLKIMRVIAFVLLFIGIILTVTGAFLLFKIKKKPEEIQLEKQPEDSLPVSSTQEAAPVPVQEATPVMITMVKEAAIEKPKPIQPAKVRKQQSTKKTIAKKAVPPPQKPAAVKKQTVKPAKVTDTKEKLPAKSRKPKQTDSKKA